MMNGLRVWQSMLMFSWAGWVNQEQLKVIDYLQGENRTLRKLIKKQRIRLSLEDRRRLAVKGRAIGRKSLEEVATIARADTILGWFRELVAEKWTFPHKQAEQGRGVRHQSGRDFLSQREPSATHDKSHRSRERDPVEPPTQSGSPTQHAKPPDHGWRLWPGGWSASPDPLPYCASRYASQTARAGLGCEPLV